MTPEAALSFFPKITQRRFADLLRFCHSTKDIESVSAEQLRACKWKEETILSFLEWRKHFDAERAEKILQQENIWTLTKDDPRFPPLLKGVFDPPFCLFIRGDISCLSLPTLAVVGARAYSAYGEMVAKKFTAELVSQGIAIVSGLALGIDGIAHRAAIEAGGKTVAVLGGGVNDKHITPREHVKLAWKILESGGAVLSEYPPGALPSKFTFPKRNRIIAGLSRGIFVVEAGKESGALITARYGLENGREVFAPPHPLFHEGGEGTNLLLKDGAHLVTCYEDIAEPLLGIEVPRTVEKSAKPSAKSTYTPEGEEEKRVLALLEKESLHIDALIKHSGLGSSTVATTLSLLEIKGVVRNRGGMVYALIE